MIDELDRRILARLQRDCSEPLEELGAAVGLSRNACWRRVKRLEEDGLVARRVALLEPEKLNVPLMVFIMIRTSQHEPGWLERFHAAVRDIPEIVGVFRTTGDIDYVLHALVPDVPAYDLLYKRLIARVPLSDVSSSFVMERIKATTEIPLGYAGS